MYAAYRNHPGVVQVLLEHGADLTVQNEDEMTATDLAVGQGNTAGINFSTGLQSKPRKKGHYHNKFDMTVFSIFKGITRPGANGINFQGFSHFPGCVGTL
jgi:ankyrin repeat protein